MQLIIEGGSIHDIDSFYAEINRVFMADEDWKLGASLDAFDDLLYGGFGVLQQTSTAEIVWKDMDKSRQALGVEATKSYYEQKLGPGSPYNQELFRTKLRELETGNGPTYFDLLLTIIAEHPTITLIQA